VGWRSPPVSRRVAATIGSATSGSETAGTFLNQPVEIH
jgi:hypothetical protein